MDEIWKDIPKYEGLYQISNYGQVKRLVGWQCQRERFLKLRKTPKRYLRVSLIKKNIKRQYFAHRLVLTAFVGPCPTKMECRHLNGNPQDNTLANLRWGTKSENVQDSICHGTRYTGNRKNNISLFNTKITELYSQGKSCAEIAYLNHCSETSVYNRLKSLGIIMRSRSEANQIFPDYIFISLYNMGLSVSQIGRLLDINSSTVTKRLHILQFPLRSRPVASRIRYTEEEFQQYFVIPGIVVQLLDGPIRVVYNY